MEVKITRNGLSTNKLLVLIAGISLEAENLHFEKSKFSFILVQRMVLILPIEEKLKRESGDPDNYREIPEQFPLL